MLRSCVFTPLAATRGATIIDQFNGNNDNGWTHVSPLSSFGAPGTFTVGAGVYEIAVPTVSSILAPPRAASVRLDRTYGDFSMQVDVVNWSGFDSTAAVGILERAGHFGLGTTTGYALVLSQNFLQIDRVTNESFTPLATTINSAPNPFFHLRMNFIGTGTTLKGELFDLDSFPHTLLATVTASDSTYATGNGGLFVVGSSSGSSAYGDFDNYIDNLVVPEPTTWLLAVIGGLGLAMVARRRAPPPFHAERGRFPQFLRNFLWSRY